MKRGNLYHWTLLKMYYEIPPFYSLVYLCELTFLVIV